MAKKAKKVRRNVVRGIVHIKATHNNTIVTITDLNGETLAWDSAGTIGFNPQRYVANHPVEISAKSTGPIRRDANECAILTVALDEDVLHGIVNLWMQRRMTPSCRQVGANDIPIPAGKRITLPRATLCRKANHRPACVFGRIHHEDSIVSAINGDVL